MIFTTDISASTAGTVINRLEAGEFVSEHERLSAISQVVNFSPRDWSNLPEENEIWSLANNEWLSERCPAETVAGQKLLAGDEPTDQERLEGLTELSSRFSACDDGELDAIQVIARGFVDS